jgi:hypothetical protein
MIKNLFIINIIIILGIVFLFFCKKKSDYSMPEATIQSNINENKINIIINIPLNHHAYLDKGEEGNLIPISFDWSDFIQKKIFTDEPILISKPNGIYDKEVKATVLRGEGKFEFQLPEIVQPKDLKNNLLKVKIQICNEISGICYRPKIYEVRL